MRADAAQRRERIVREARRLLAERGGDVPLDAVAESAGVGIATLYRNFEARPALLDAVALAIMKDIEDAAGSAFEALDADQARGPEVWESFVRRLVELDLGALASAMAGHAATPLSDAVSAAQEAARVKIHGLLERAQDLGFVRKDIDVPELVIAVGIVTRPQPKAVQEAAPGLGERLVAILLDGLRPAAH